jgi:NADP-dependent 3-hydroxy acid dehydrogenase YdfG
MDLKNKTALITGASSGIGAGTAKVLARNGIKVGLAARRTQKLNELKREIEAEGGTALVIEMDVTDREAVKTGVAKFIDEFGSLDILVNNAGLMPLSDIEQLLIDEWQQMVDVNLKGALTTTWAALPYLIKQKKGHIFNMSSVAGRKVVKGLSVYCATKFALAAFSEGLRMELAPEHNIRVTCIQPGAVDTELYDHISVKKYQDAMADLAKQFKFISSEEIGESILFALQQPDHVNIGEIFVMPTKQGW